MMQTTRSGTIVEVAEGGASAEATFVWTERQEPMREIADHVPVTEIQLEDVAQIQTIIDADLQLMVMQRLDGQLIAGTGVAPQIHGVTTTRNSAAATTSNWSVTSAKRSSQINDLRKIKTKTKLACRSMPNVYLIHDNIWDEVVVSESTSGGYHLGNPANDFQERLWGLPVVQTDHLTDADASTSLGAIVMDTMWFRLWFRRGIHSEIGLNSDDFTKRQVTIRAAVRACLQARRPQAAGTLVMP